jgi:hypothetical protein
MGCLEPLNLHGSGILDGTLKSMKSYSNQHAECSGVINILAFGVYRGIEICC